MAYFTITPAPMVKIIGAPMGYFAVIRDLRGPLRGTIDDARVDCRALERLDDMARWSRFVFPEPMEAQNQDQVDLCIAKAFDSMDEWENEMTLILGDLPDVVVACIGRIAELLRDPVLTDVVAARLRGETHTTTTHKFIFEGF